MASFVREVADQMGATAAGERYSRILKIDDIETDLDIRRVFTVDEGLIGEIAADIRERGFDPAFPLVVWKRGGKRVLTDGHTRVLAAIRAGLTEIPVCEKEFGSKEEALLYTYRCQKLRRNLTQAEILNAAGMLCNKRGRYGKEGSSAAEVAKDLGISRNQMTHARKVIREASAADIAAIQKNTPGVTINSVYEKLKKRKEPEAAAFLPPAESVSAKEEPPDVSCAGPAGPDESAPPPVSAKEESPSASGGEDSRKSRSVKLHVLIKELVGALKGPDIAAGSGAYLSVRKALGLAVSIYTEGKQAGIFNGCAAIPEALELLKGTEAAA